MTFLVDTNVFVYAAEQGGSEHARCRDLVQAWQQRLEPWYTTWPILYEFMRISTHFAQMPELVGNVLHDAHTAILMREHGIHRVVTRDAGFHRFPFLEVTDPLRL